MNKTEKALQELIDALWDTEAVDAVARFHNHGKLEAAIAKAQMILAEVKSCPEFVTEANLLNYHSEPCVSGDWHCELPEGHGGTHQHTHTFKWNTN